MNENWAIINEALLVGHQKFMEIAKAMKANYDYFTVTMGHRAGHKPCHFWTIARKETGLTKDRCLGYMAAFRNFSELDDKHGRHIEPAALHYSRLCSAKVVRQMIRKAKKGEAISLTTVRFLHREDCGEPFEKQGFTLLFTQPNGKIIRFIHSTNTNITAAQLERQIERSEFVVIENCRGRKAA